MRGDTKGKVVKNLKDMIVRGNRIVRCLVTITVQKRSGVCSYQVPIDHMKICHDK